LHRDDSRDRRCGQTLGRFDESSRGPRRSCKRRVGWIHADDGASGSTGEGHEVEAVIRSQSQICNQQIGRHRQDVLTGSLKIAASRDISYRGQDPLQRESASDIRFDNQDALGCSGHVEPRWVQDASQFRADLHTS